MVFTFLNNLHFIFPLNLFNNEYFFLKNKYIIVKYVYFKIPNHIFFVKLIKYINNIYYITKKLLNCIKKKNIITRNNLSKSTKKIYRQKGLGKARVGSLKSPLHRGGSILFGPVSKKLDVLLQKKQKKISFFYLLLNKRTYISFIFIMPIIYTFENNIEYLNRQKRIKGLFSKNILYVIFYNMKNKNNSFININSLNINSFLNFDYIIFLI